MKTNVYINKIENIKLDKMCILKNFDIFELNAFIDFKSEERFSIARKLKEFTNDVCAIKYVDSGKAYVLIKKNSVTEKQLNEEFKKAKDGYAKQILNIKNEHIDIILNLLLFASTFDVGDTENAIADSTYCKILDVKGKKKGQLVTLSFEIKNRLLYYKVLTFTNYKAATGKAKSGIKYVKNGKCMSRIYNKSLYNEEDLYVIQSSMTNKNHVNVFNTDAKSITESKFVELGKVYEILKSSKYIKELEFKNIETTDAVKDIFEGRNKVNNFTNFTHEKCIEIANEIGINIVYQNGAEEIKINEALIDNDITNFKTTKSLDKNMLNLFVIDNSNKGKDKESDDIYDSHKDKDFIIQHIGKNNINGTLSAKIKTCIYNLIIKYELKNKSIKTFDWETFKKHSKSTSYKFYEFDKDKNYCMMEVDNNGNILDFRRENYSFDDNCDYCDAESRIITNNFGDMIQIIDTEMFMVPRLEEFAEKMKSIDLGLNMEIRFEDLNNCLIQIQMDDPSDKVEELIAEIYKSIIGLDKNKYKEHKIIFDELKKSIDKKYQKSGAWKIIKLELESYYLNLYLQTPKWYYDLKGFTPGETGDTLYPGFINIHYNDEYYTVSGYKPCETSKNFANNVLIRNIEVLEGDNFFEELLLMLMNPIVKTDMLTVYPFVYKYIREMV